MNSSHSNEGALASGLHTQPTRHTPPAPKGQDAVNVNNHRQPEPMLLQPSEAAHMLGVSRSTLYELMDAGAIPSLKIGRARRIPREALEVFIAERLAVADDR